MILILVGSFITGVQLWLYLKRRSNSLQDEVMYAPVYQVQYKGEMLTLSSLIYYSSCDIKVNQMREIKIDLQDPHNFIEVKKQTLSLTAQVLVIAFIIVWVLASIYYIWH